MMSYPIIKAVRKKEKYSFIDDIRIYWSVDIYKMPVKIGIENTDDRVWGVWSKKSIEQAISLYRGSLYRYDGVFRSVGAGGNLTYIYESDFDFIYLGGEVKLEDLL